MLTSAEIINYDIMLLLFFLDSSDNTSPPVISPTVYSLGHWTEWGAWECAHLSGLCYMVRHRHCTAPDDACPEFSYMIEKCDTNECDKGTLQEVPIQKIEEIIYLSIL